MKSVRKTLWDFRRVGCERVFSDVEWEIEYNVERVVRDIIKRSKNWVDADLWYSLKES